MQILTEADYHSALDQLDELYDLRDSMITERSSREDLAAVEKKIAALEKQRDAWKAKNNNPATKGSGAFIRGAYSGAKGKGWKRHVDALNLKFNRKTAKEGSLSDHEWADKKWGTELAGLQKRRDQIKAELDANQFMKRGSKSSGGAMVAAGMSSKEAHYKPAEKKEAPKAGLMDRLLGRKTPAKSLPSNQPGHTKVYSSKDAKAGKPAPKPPPALAGKPSTHLPDRVAGASGLPIATRDHDRAPLEPKMSKLAFDMTQARKAGDEEAKKKIKKEMELLRTKRSIGEDYMPLMIGEGYLARAVYKQRLMETQQVLAEFDMGDFKSKATDVKHFANVAVNKIIKRATYNQRLQNLERKIDARKTVNKLLIPSSGRNAEAHAKDAYRARMGSLSQASKMKRYDNLVGAAERDTKGAKISRTANANFARRERDHAASEKSKHDANYASQKRQVKNWRGIERDAKRKLRSAERHDKRLADMKAGRKGGYLGSSK